MNIDRLERLSKLLREEAARIRRNEPGFEFNLALYVAQSVRSFGHILRWAPSHDCNTVGCAIGLAMVSGQDFGLKPNEAGVPITSHGDTAPFIGTKAIAHAFDINLYQVEHLFLPAYYNIDQMTGADGAEAVADRIDSLLAAHGGS